MQHDEMANTVYYENELDDDFSGIPPKNYFIPKDYKYIHKNLFYRLASFFVYRFVLTPFGIIYNQVTVRQRFVNRKVLRKFHGKGCFLYGNHTNMIGNGLTPSLAAFPKKVYVVVSPDNMAIKGLATLFRLGGALPIPSTIEGMPNFLAAIQYAIRKKCCVAIYPEAHLWPYCTTIRNFRAVSFKYPVMYDVPAFAFTDCYKKRRFGKRPRVVTYIDGPFYVDKSLPEAKRAQDLRDRVYAAMKARADKESTYAIFRYLPKKEGSKE